jgi:hypothetical protein
VAGVLGCPNHLLLLLLRVLGCPKHLLVKGSPQHDQ